MTIITNYEKGTAKLLEQDLLNQHHAVYKANLDSANITKLIKVNNNLEIHLVNGEKVIIEDYFVGEFPKELVLESSTGKFSLVDLKELDELGVVTKVDYLGIDDFQAYLLDGISQATIPNWAWAAGAAGAIGVVAAVAGGGSGSSSNSDSGNNSGNSDSILDQLLANAEAAVKAAEDAHGKAQEAINQADKDGNGVITLEEQQAVQSVIDESSEKKAIAEATVDALPESAKEQKDDYQERLDNLTDLTPPVVTDANHNGVDDLVESQINALVKAAEAAYKKAHDDLRAAQSDEIISQIEHDALVKAFNEAQAAKDAAQIEVDKLATSDGKTEFQDRLDALNDFTVPAVTDANNNGVDDTTDLAEAEVAVKAAEEAYGKAQEAIQTADTNGNGLITAEEQKVVQDAIDQAAELKAIAESAVDTLPVSQQSAKDAFEVRLDALEPLTAPAITDANNNGVDDTTDLAEAEAAVVAAEAK